MADVKISALPAATTPLAGTEVLPIVQSGVTTKVAVSNLTAGRAVTLGTGSILGTPASGILTSCTGLNYDGFKNRIINGAMVIDQRNAGAAVTVSTSVNTFPVDRLALISTGATTTAQRVAGTGAYTYDVLYTGAASVTNSYLFQRIESFNCLDLVSKNITFQVQLSSTTVTSVAVGLFSGNSTDTFTAPVTISTTTFTITSTPTIYTWTVNAGANAANGLQIQLNFGAFTSGTARISGMQLEKGSTATSFDYRPYGTELALCQRYLPAISGANGASSGSIGLGGFYDTTHAVIGIAFQVPTRIAPTGVTISAASDFAVDGITSATCTAIAFSSTSTIMAGINITYNTVTTTGSSGRMRTNSASALMLFTGCEL